NADGIVHVTARDRETGAQAATRITLSSGLSEGELEHILEERRTERVQTDAIPAPGREVLGAVKLVPTPVRSVPEARERKPRPPAPPVAAPEAVTDEIPVLDESPATGSDEPDLFLPESAEEDLLDVSLDPEPPALPPRERPSDEDLLDVSLDAPGSLFDDGDD